MARIGLVLGAGGAVGGAFHAGVLSALVEGAGWDARGAEIVVGTSAGSVTGAILRAGLPPVDLVARATGRPLSAEGERVVRRVGRPGAYPSFPLRPRPPADAGRRRMANPSLAARLALRPWSARPGALAAALLPPGSIPTSAITEGLAGLLGTGWPTQPLWVCAVRLDDGRRVVFGRDDGPRPPVAQAVAASCAIPGYFTPVDIGGTKFVDGGVHSVCNLDILAGLGLDLVVVSAPMSMAGRQAGLQRDSPLRVFTRAQLDREALGVRRRGTPVLAFQPTPEDRQTMGLNAMDGRRRGPVAKAIRQSVLRRLERADIRDRVAVLSSS